MTPLWRDRITRLALVAALAVSTLTVVAAGPTAGRAEAAPTSSLSCVDRLQPSDPVPVDLVSYDPITPRRIVDTRDGTGGHLGLVPTECTLRVVLDDVLTAAGGGAPVAAVALSVTAVSQFRGFLTVFACADGRPPTSNVNTRDDSATPGLVVVAPDADGAICVFSRLDAHVLIDVQGTFSDGSNRFTPIAPVRAYDTRELPGGAPVPGGAIRNVRLAGTFVPDDATAVVVNLTVTQTQAPGWILAYPCGVSPPLASNGNYEPNESVAVAAIVGLGDRAGGEGQICLTSLATTHVIVDVVGYYSPSDFGPTSVTAASPSRLVDTRTPEGPWSRPFADDETRRIDPLAGHPDRKEAMSVTINAIGLDVEEAGFLTFFPCNDLSARRPVVSTLNTVPGRAVSNLLTVELSDDGSICVYSRFAADVVLDLVSINTLPAGSQLRRLDFDRADGQPSTIFPDFAPEQTDYAIACPTITNTIDIEAIGHGGSTVGVDGSPVTRGNPRRIQVVADDLTVVTVAPPAGGGAAIDYSFRCLPRDFPALSIQRPGTPSPGWYLTALTPNGASPTSTFLVALDDHGAPVWYRRAGPIALNPELLDDGRISLDFGGGPYSADSTDSAVVIDLDGNVLETVTTDDPAAFPLDHHGLLANPDGGWTLLSYPLLTGVDLTAVKGPTGGPTDPVFGPSEFAVDNSIREVGPGGALQWEWNAIDHFDLGEIQFPVRFFQYRSPAQGGEVDLFHINSIFRIDDGSNDYLASFRHLDAVTRIDRTSGKVEWILTSPAVGRTLPANPDGAKRLQVIGDPFGGPRRQHDARLEGDVLTLYDNRTATAEPARAVAYRIDEVAGTATMLWQILEPQGRNSPGLGVTRVVGDDHVLVGWGALQPMFQEYDADRALVLSITQVPAGNAFRITKYGPEAFDRDVLRAAAGGVVGG